MKYKELIEQKLDRLSNLVTSVNSLVAIGTSREEIRKYFSMMQDTLEEIQSLIKKEN